MGGGPGRRGLLWSLAGVMAAARSDGLALADAGAAAGLDDFSPRELWMQEERLLGFSPRGHVLELFRAELEEQGYLRTGQARSAPDGLAVSIAGVPVRPHRPPTRSGKRLVFLALEDEEGLVEVMVPEEVYKRDGAALFPAAPLLAADGRVRRRGAGMSLVADRMAALEPAGD
jgi:error-prone DNA polymerase